MSAMMSDIFGIDYAALLQGDRQWCWFYSQGDAPGYSMSVFQTVFG